MKSKAVCVMRTDLKDKNGYKVSKGKLIAQGGHAFVGLITNMMTLSKDGYEYEYSLFAIENGPVIDWLTNSLTKIVLAVNSEKELLEIYNKAEESKLNAILITDSGHTVFDKSTNTCVGIGPDWDKEIDLITGHLLPFSF